MVTWLADEPEKMNLQMYCWLEHFSSWSSQTRLLRRATDVMWDRSFSLLLQMWRPPQKWTRRQIHRPLSSFILLYPFVKEIPIEYAVKLLEAGGSHCQRSRMRRYWIGQELSKTGAQDAALCRRIAKKLQVHLPPWRSWNLLFGMHVITVLVLRHRQVRGFEFFIIMVFLYFDFKKLYYSSYFILCFFVCIQVSSWKHETCWSPVEARRWWCSSRQSCLRFCSTRSFLKDISTS